MEPTMYEVKLLSVIERHKVTNSGLGKTCLV